MGVEERERETERSNALDTHTRTHGNYHAIHTIASKREQGRDCKADRFFLWCFTLHVLTPRCRRTRTGCTCAWCIFCCRLVEYIEAERFLLCMNIRMQQAREHGRKIARTNTRSHTHSHCLAPSHACTRTLFPHTTRTRTPQIFCVFFFRPISLVSHASSKKVE